MNWTTTTDTDFKVGDKVKIVNGVDKEFLDKTFTIKRLTTDKKLCILEKFEPFKIFQTKYLILVNNTLEIE